MAQVDPQKTINTEEVISSQSLSYKDVISYFDSNWKQPSNLKAIAQLDASFNYPSKATPSILISGTNGKSITAHFTAKLLHEEGIKIGSFFTPHIETYNERLAINNVQISNKDFTDFANLVIQRSKQENITASTKDILTMMSFLYFKKHNVDLAVFENSDIFAIDPVMHVKPIIAAITRLVPNHETDDIHKAVMHIMSNTSSKTHFVSADQNKLNLQIMHQIAETKGCHWSMPIRKLAPLAYPFEQLHGRCAALAERIAHIYIDNYVQLDKNSHSLLNKPKGQRGRPTLEAKREEELNPKKTLEQFWNNTSTSLNSHFELNENVKPHVLLDNADNLDGFSNLFLGIRLLHYKKPFKGLAIIIGCNENQFDNHAFIKQIRYFFKKNSGTVIFYPPVQIPGEKNGTSWDPTFITNIAKNSKIKAKACTSLTEAINTAQKIVDEREGLVVITGNSSLKQEFLQYEESNK